MTHNSPLASPRATLETLETWGLTAQKSLGQHFLIDDGIVGRIVRLASLQQKDNVLEVGPGIGTLTRALLAQGAVVVALEKDRRLLPLLEDLQVHFPQHFSYLHIDALDYVAQLKKQGTSFADKPFSMVANLPYAVAATIVLDYFEHVPALTSATVMVQKEVADRMMAQVGTKDYGAYSVKLQLIARAHGSFAVGRTCFFPAPRVDSTVIRLDRRDDQIANEDIPATFLLIEAAFTQRRKTLRNSMRAFFAQEGLDLALVDVLLEKSGIPPAVRGETLGLDDFTLLGKLCNKIQKTV